MRIRAALGTLLAIVIVVAALGYGIERITGTGVAAPHGYLVRAVFDNSSFVTPGEQVKVSGVTVGTIQAVQLTEANQAAVVLSITNRRFTPFRADAHCEIGLESLLGEQYVQCTPTQSRPAGASAPAPLALIHAGAGRGEHLLPVAGTTTPVGFDLLLDMNRLPLLQRLRLFVSGLGVGLDANGHELNLALQRSDPALEQTDHVIRVLADQDRVLARLTDESAQVLAPLARQRAHLGGFLVHAGAVAQTSASESRAIEANLADLPPFLNQLRPAARRLEALADAGTPSLTALDDHASEINTAVSQLGPLAGRATPALVTLGRVAQRGTTVFPAAHRATADLLSLATPLVPVARDIAATASSFDQTGGIEDVMRFIYYYTGAVNGEDSLGHYVRTLLEIGGCSPRAPKSVPGCQATFNAFKGLGPESARPAALSQAGASTADAPADEAAGASQAVVESALRSVRSPASLSALRPLTRYLLGR